MVDRSAEHWYPTAAYLYVLHLDDLALAWEYLRRNPDYRLDWLRCHRRPQAAQQAAHRWGLRLLEDPALDAREAHPAWLPGHTAVVQLYPDEDPPSDAVVFAFWRIPGHKQLIHDGKRLVLAARWPGRSLRFALAPAWRTAWLSPMPCGPAPQHPRAVSLSAWRWLRRLRPLPSRCPGRRRPRCWNCTPCRRSTPPWRVRPCARWPRVCSAWMPRPIGTPMAACARRCAAWRGVAMR
ncbi:hypothetical protein Q024_00999 [Pseudomonas aeruginosa BWHPSA011]|nr:hypothetical protein Q024_00999 [Pseudomonas aeruginosa BWHPSA011]